jgi:hypothetical protein
MQSSFLRRSMEGNLSGLSKMEEKKRDTLEKLREAFGIEDLSSQPRKSLQNSLSLSRLLFSCPMERKRSIQRGRVLFHLFILLLHSMRTCRRESRSDRDFEIRFL